MSPEIEEKLVKDFPKFFAQHGGDMRLTCMARGCECGDGWEGIISWAAEQLEPLGVEAAQIKEKFGTLRLYCDYPEGMSDDDYEEANSIVSRAEAATEKTCEICGAQGKLRGKGWISGRCDACWEKQR